MSAVPRNRDAYCSVLECTSTASDKEIRAAFRRLALRYHPDKCGGESSQFVQILEAYEALTGARSAGACPNFHSMNLDELFTFLNPSSEGEEVELAKMSDTVMTMKIYARTARFGTTMRRKVVRQTVKKGPLPLPKANCRHCGGSGVMYNTVQQGLSCSREGQRCFCTPAAANHTEFIEDYVDVLIEPGTRTGQEIRLSNQGNQCPNAQPGDLVFLVEVCKDPKYHVQATWISVLEMRRLGSNACSVPVVYHNAGGHVKCHVQLPSLQELQSNAIDGVYFMSRGDFELQLHLTDEYRLHRTDHEPIVMPQHSTPHPSVKEYLVHLPTMRNPKPQGSVQKFLQRILTALLDMLGQGWELELGASWLRDAFGNSYEVAPPPLPLLQDANLNGCSYTFRLGNNWLNFHFTDNPKLHLQPRVSTRQRGEKAEDMVVDLEVSASSARDGATVQKEVVRQVLKKGFRNRAQELEECFTVTVEPGAQSGEKIRLAGCGNQNPEAEPGDVVFVVRVDDSEAEVHDWQPSQSQSRSHTHSQPRSCTAGPMRSQSSVAPRTNTRIRSQTRTNRWTRSHTQQTQMEQDPQQFSEAPVQALPQNEDGSLATDEKPLTLNDLRRSKLPKVV